MFEEFAAAGGYDLSLFKQLVIGVVAEAAAATVGGCDFSLLVELVAGVVAAAERNFSLLEDIVEAGLTPAASITRGAGSVA